MKQYLKLMRVKQYVKNLLVFSPLFFAGQFNDATLLFKCLIAFIAFSLTASAVYILNDIKDVESDKKHPEKRFRPIASGAISAKKATGLMVVLIMAGFVLAFLAAPGAVILVASYLGLNILYTLILKHIPLLDVTVIAIGFILRLFLGSIVTDIPLSHWIVLMTFLLAVFLALAKRRDDVLKFNTTGEKMRKVIDGYNLQLIDLLMAMMAAVILVCYILYTMSDEVLERVGESYLYLTSLFVFLGIAKYFQITLVQEKSGSPTKMLYSNVFLQIIILLWIVSFGAFIYL